jgi:hypothetical protein
MSSSRELDQDELTFADKSDLIVALMCILMLGGVLGWILHEQYIAKKLAETPGRHGATDSAATRVCANDATAVHEAGARRNPRSLPTPRAERTDQTQGLGPSAFHHQPLERGSCTHERPIRPRRRFQPHPPHHGGSNELLHDAFEERARAEGFPGQARQHPRRHPVGLRARPAADAVHAIHRGHQRAPEPVGRCRHRAGPLLGSLPVRVRGDRRGWQVGDVPHQAHHR